MPPRQNSQSPAVPSTRKTPGHQQAPPLPGEFVPGLDEGSWEAKIVLPSSTHHRPLGIPWLKAWRWGRRECFRRLTHHIQAPNRHPSWAPVGHAGLHSWWARWLVRASCPWYSRHWSPRFHLQPRKNGKGVEKERGGGRRDKKQKTSDRGEQRRKMRDTKVQSDSRREGQGREIEEKLHIEHSEQENAQQHNFYLNQQIPGRERWVKKQQLRS